MTSTLAYLRKRSYHAAWMLAITFSLLSVCYHFIFPDATVDVNIHDTYIVVSNENILTVLAVWLAICGIVYWIINRLGIKPILWLVVIHVLLTLVFGTCAIPRFNTTINWEYYDPIILFALIGFLIGQVAFFLNILISIVIKLTKK